MFHGCLCDISHITLFSVLHTPTATFLLPVKYSTEVEYSCTVGRSTNLYEPTKEPTVVYWPENNVLIAVLCQSWVEHSNER